MMEFLLAVLGSFVFWGVYFLMSIVFTVVFMKKCFPSVYLCMTGRKEKVEIEWEITDVDIFLSSLLILLTMAFWPVILTGIVLFYLFKIVFWMIGKSMVFVFTNVDKAIPYFDITIKNKDD